MPCRLELGDEAVDCTYGSLKCDLKLCPFICTWLRSLQSKSMYAFKIASSSHVETIHAHNDKSADYNLELEKWMGTKKAIYHLRSRTRNFFSLFIWKSYTRTDEWMIGPFYWLFGLSRLTVAFQAFWKALSFLKAVAPHQVQREFWWIIFVN